MRVWRRRGIAGVDLMKLFQPNLQNFITARRNLINAAFYVLKFPLHLRIYSKIVTNVGTYLSVIFG
jgi:hypothetical protein